MHYTTTYESPLGGITLAADGEALTGLWFEGQKYFALYLDKEHEEKDLPVFEQTKQWLDIYFSGRNPDFTPPMHFTGSDFQNEVWAILAAIHTARPVPMVILPGRWPQNGDCPGCLHRRWAALWAKTRFPIIVPCHRVVGTNGSLTGYAGGIRKKIELLRLEGALKDEYFVPRHSTAP